MRWVHVKADHTISWGIQPHKRSINFGLFKHPGNVASVPSAQSSAVALSPPSPGANAADDDKNEVVVASTAIEKLTSIGLRRVRWVGKCEADKVTQGRYELPPGEAGNYALVFDNTFSKNTSKTATFFLLTFPTACQSQIQFGAQVHHSQAMPSAMASAMAIAASSSQSPGKSPKLRARAKDSVDSLQQASASQPFPSSLPSSGGGTAMMDESPSIHTGVLQKRRRKKHQGYARRFFCLDYTSSTLSYYHDRNSSALRGAIPLALAAIGANAKSREISIDSGAEIWHLRANNQADFEAWKKALETASRMMVEATTPPNRLNLQTQFQPPDERTSVAEDQEWVKLETLLSRISGTRDALRRLCLDTLAQPLPPPSPRLGSGPTTPTEMPNDEYFKQDEKRLFWKRKPISTGTYGNIFKRSASAQLTVPPAGAEPVLRNGQPSPGVPFPPQRHDDREEGLYDHCRAILRDLDAVVAEFSTLVNESRIRRAPAPKSAVSRLSLQSIESQEYFDAEDHTRLLDIHSDSDHGEVSEIGGDEESTASSDILDEAEILRRPSRAGSLSSVMPPKSKALSPLPLSPVQRRKSIPAPTIMPPSLIGFLRKNVGKDLSTISMPVSANEPLSMLQRAAEQLEYSDLLDRAVRAIDTVDRLLHVTAFAVSSLSNSRVKERSVRKPFNPMLGETFELVREDRGFRLLAEKVSHRPVQLALHAESSHWAFTQSPLPSQKFWGKSSEIITEGKARLVLHSTGERYSWSAATCFLRNIIAGEKYVEPVGTMTVVNETTGQKAVVTFKAKGMFSGRSEEVEVHAVDAQGTQLPLGLQGTWTQSLQLLEHGVESTTVWTAGPLVVNAPKHYGMTLFAVTLNEITSIEVEKLPPTDSRLRPDQRALEKGDYDLAEELKNKLEEMQRARRREMELSGDTWKPRWFSRVDNGDEVVWKLKTGREGYWEERAKGHWTGIIPVLDP